MQSTGIYTLFVCCICTAYSRSRSIH